MRILIVDDHQIFRDGLKSCLVESKADCYVVGEADNGREGIEAAASLKPDLVIMDIAMPKLNGVDAARQILQSPHALRPKLLVLSSYADPEFVTEVLRVGASGYLLKSAAFEELVCAIQTVEQGKLYLSPEIAGVVVDLHVRDEASETNFGRSFRGAHRPRTRGHTAVCRRQRCERHRREVRRKPEDGSRNAEQGDG